MKHTRNTNLKPGYILKADGEQRGGCHDLPEVDPVEFHRLGGQDITVWQTRYTVEADRLAAIDYAIEQLQLAVDIIHTPNEILDEAEYRQFQARGGLG
jgi:hypothetical protein